MTWCSTWCWQLTYRLRRLWHDDRVWTGDAGDDTIDGGTGNDSLLNGERGQRQHPLVVTAMMSSSGTTTAAQPVGREDNLTLQWNQVAPSNGTELGASQTYAVGGMNVNVGFQAQD